MWMDDSSRTLPWPYGKSRSGMVALILVIALMLILGIVAYAFESLSESVRRQIHLSYLGDRALTLARAAIDEAIIDFEIRLNKDSGSPTDAIDLYAAVRTTMTSQPVSYQFRTVLTTRATDLLIRVDPVNVVVQRMQDGPVKPPAYDVSKIGPTTREKIKAGFQEYYRSGICGPDMDLGFQLQSTDTSAAVGMAAFKSKVSVSTDRADVVRELEVRRVFNHDVTTYVGSKEMLRQLGVLPPPGTKDPFGLLTTLMSGASMFSSDQVHISPFDTERIVWRSEESTRW
jgi:hypothetical protein